MNKSELMLKYQKAKVKLLEYKIEESDYPNFQYDYHELSLPTIMALSEYADAIVKDDTLKADKFHKALRFSAQYYDSAFKSRELKKYDIDFLVIGVISYFFNEDYGSASVLLKSIDKQNISDDNCSILAECMSYILFGQSSFGICHPLVQELRMTYTKNNYSNLFDLLNKNQQKAFLSGDERDSFFADMLVAIIKISTKSNAFNLMPLYSKTDTTQWSSYFSQEGSIKCLWPSQNLLGSSGILCGNNGVVKLPTGVGKTKSIELIIRSMIVSGRGTNTLIVAPLRALCNEIHLDLQNSFESEIAIDQYSDVLEQDYTDSFVNDDATIIICTPEKLQYIIHHDSLFMDNIDLIIFDEGHLFNDLSRGALFELLLTDIKYNLKDNQQLLLFSAVLSHEQQITQWLFGSETFLIHSDKIQATPKLIGFTSKDSTIHYYTNDWYNEDFFIPKTVRQKTLNLKGREYKKRVFPENKAFDLAIYYMNSLCDKGGVGIYVSQKKSVKTVINRFIEVLDRGYSFDSLVNRYNPDELKKLAYLISLYYGKEHIYTEGAFHGLFPHYSSLPNGLRLAIEYAMKKNWIRAIVCTSSLAQGVNIPIEHLLLTSLRTAQSVITYSDLHNLIGRSGRAGIYTEGNILITDPTIFDSKNDYYSRYKWLNSVHLFASDNKEKSGSAILSLVQDCNIRYDFVIPGEKVTDIICKYEVQDWNSELESMIRSEKNYSDQFASDIEIIIKQYREIISTIESEICNVILTLSEGNEENSIDIVETATNLVLNNLLSFTLANDFEKERLAKVFKKVSEIIKQHPCYVKQSSLALSGIEKVRLIEEFISSNDLDEQYYDEQNLLRIIIEFYNTLHSDETINASLCNKWIAGDSFDAIVKEFMIETEKVEKLCSSIISYELQFLVGNIIDALSEECVNQDVICLLQKKLQYGVNNEVAIFICENIFNERIIAIELSEQLEKQDGQEIRDLLMENKGRVLSALEKYPTFFKDMMKHYLR